MKIVLKMDLKRAKLISAALEAFARTGMFQFDMVLERLSNYSFPKDMIKLIENIATNTVSNKCNIDPEKCRQDIHNAAWDAYQWLRREIAWHEFGKDWRKDKRDWSEQLEVIYDAPLRTFSNGGDFETFIERDVE